MLYVDSMYGHTDDVNEIVSYSKQRIISVGADNQLIFYKANEDTQLLYKNTKASTSCVTVVDDEYIVTGSEQSTVDLWSLKKKKPVHRVIGALNDSENGGLSWVTQVSAI